MAARIKSQVTTREEKAFGAVDMNRVMMSGTGAAFVYALARMMQLGVLMIPAVFIAFFFFIWLTGKKGGVPRYMMFVYNWQGRVLLSARRQPESIAARFAKLAGWTVSDVIVNGDNLFTASVGISFDDDMAGLEILDTDSLDAGGFEIVTDDDLFLTIEVSAVSDTET